MKTPPPTIPISDDLRGVLEDIAKSSKQQLFSGYLLSHMDTVFASQGEIARATQPGLSPAERHVLRMHRQELALALQHGFFNQFFATGGPAERIGTYAEKPLSSDWRDRAIFARDTAGAESFMPGTGRWLRRLLNGETLTTNTQYQSLLAASLRLAESPNAHLYSGLSHRAYNCDTAALAKFTRLFKNSPPPMQLHAIRPAQNLLLDHGQIAYASIIGHQAIQVIASTGNPQLLARELATMVIRKKKYGQAWRVLPSQAKWVASQPEIFVQELERTAKGLGSLPSYAKAINEALCTDPKDLFR